MGESSSADQVYDTEFCQTQFLQDWLLPFSCECWRKSSTTRGSPKSNDAADGPRGESLGVIFWQLYVLFFAIEQRTEWGLNAGIDYYYSVWVTNYARLWVIDDLLINYYRHISTITIFFIFLLFKFIVCDVCCDKRWQLQKEKRSVLLRLKKQFRVYLVVCVCLFVCVSNGHTVGKEGSW